MNDLAGAIKAAMNRSIHSGTFEGEPAVRATTYTGSQYAIEFTPGVSGRDLHYADEHVNGTYLVRETRSVTINGELVPNAAAVGFNFTTGTLLVLDADFRMIRRSSTIQTMES